MNDKWTYFPVQPLADGEEVSVGELLQVVHGRYAGIFVRVVESYPDERIRVQTVGLRSLLVTTTLSRSFLARDSVVRRYIMGIVGLRELREDLAQRKELQDLPEQQLNEKEEQE